MTTIERIPEKLFCNCLAMQRGLDPAGHAGCFADALIVECPLPWKADSYRQASALPQSMIDLFGLWLQRWQAGQGYPHRPLLVAPDAAYGRPGYRRVMFYRRPEGAIARFEKQEYLVPDDALGPLVWTWFEARDELSRFERYRAPEGDTVRDLLVCTHGNIDAACGKFGYPLYRHMRDTCASDTTRVWRVSHFGGHVFAPTLMDMPTGHYWAWIEPAQAEQLTGRSGDVGDLRGHYRGWAGVASGFVQAAERELWQRHGWTWFDYLKSGEIVAQATDDEPQQWAEVRIDYTVPGANNGGSYRARVEVERTLETQPSSNDTRTQPYAQYIVRDVTHSASA